MHLDRPATEKAAQYATRLTKRHLVKPFWVLIVPFLFPQALAAEPSLAETIQYIEGKLGSETYVFTPGPEATLRDKYEGKTLKLSGQTVTYSYNRSPYPVRDVYCEFTFQLSDLSTTVAAFSKDVQEIFGKQFDQALFSDRYFQILGAVKISCARRKCISLHTTHEGKQSGGLNNLMTLTFYVDPDDVEKVQKALTHAIKLSGGKDELF